ncbi:MAG: Lrp/AsnC family transcriptional regulator [Deltaproteobacteria bacterium]|jgi:DNA-binding Lrp family transcriptional regulator|nr:Lrp/AsnC family transcriptional regulator [Deltaproteobacteria bacterium]
MSAEYQNFTETERNILRIVQEDLPESLTPYADIAKIAGTDEDFVLNLLRRLKDTGSIRRFGASIKHQRAGYSHNAMIAWTAHDLAEAEQAGAIAATHPLISHCYYRPSIAPDWPYNMFTMTHGRHKDQYLEVIDFILQNTTLKTYAVLRSLKELKKISMLYF